MSNIAIRADHLSKLYHIGALQQRHATTSILRRCSGQAVLSAGLRDALTSAFGRQEAGIRRGQPLTPDS